MQSTAGVQYIGWKVLFFMLKVAQPKGHQISLSSMQDHAVFLACTTLNPAGLHTLNLKAGLLLFQSSRLNTAVYAVLCKRHVCLSRDWLVLEQERCGLAWPTPKGCLGSERCPSQFVGLAHTAPITR